MRSTCLARPLARLASSLARPRTRFDASLLARPRTRFACWAQPCCCALMLLTGGCAEGGIDDAELGTPSAVKSKSDGGSRIHDARVSGDESADTLTGPGDAGRNTSGSSVAGSTSAGRDAGRSTASVGTIKCPSPMICTDAIATLLSALDSTVKAGQSLCAESGPVLPTAVSCQTVNECKSARLTTGTCSGGYCIQPCTP